MELNLDVLRQQKDSLVEFSSLNEDDILDMWFTPGEPLIKPKDIILYRNDVPLYVKMIWRFRENKKNPISFYFSVDCGAMKLIRKRFKLNNETLSLFRFITFTLIPAEIPNSAIWRKNQVKWFYQRSDLYKKQLIKFYNDKKF